MKYYTMLTSSNRRYCGRVSAAEVIWFCKNRPGQYRFRFYAVLGVQ